MPPTDPLSILTNFLNSPTFLGFMIVLALYGGMREWWVFGREHRRCLAELEEKTAEVIRWQNMALALMHLAERASGDALDLVDTVSSQGLPPPSDPPPLPPRPPRRRSP